jgi:hypothetical protein
MSNWKEALQLSINSYVQHRYICILTSFRQNNKIISVTLSLSEALSVYNLNKHWTHLSLYPIGGIHGEYPCIGITFRDKYDDRLHRHLLISSIIGVGHVLNYITRLEYYDEVVAKVKLFVKQQNSVISTVIIQLD